MRVTIFSRYFAPAYLAGGPVQTLGALVRATADDVEVDVVTTDRDHGVPEAMSVEADGWVPWHGAQVRYASGGLSSLVRGLRDASGRRPDHLYVNSFFDFRFSVLPQVLSRLGMFPRAEVLVAPRGELNRGALALKPTKKRIFLKVYRALGFAGRVRWHASTDLEADDIRRAFGPTSRILVRQNDTQLPPLPLHRNAREPGPCRLVFASRLSAKKRLDLLLRSLAQVRGDYRLRVIGAFDDPVHERLCRDLAQVEPLRGRVEFVGPLTRAEVLEAFEKADAFVFPTAGENFGHVMAEALSSACPVIASVHTPWTGVLRSGGGAVVQNDTESAWSDVISRFVGAGEQDWIRSSLSAADAYARWVEGSDEPHVFEMLRRAAQVR